LQMQLLSLIEFAFVHGWLLFSGPGM